MKGLDLKKKVGPLPVWAWGIIFGVVGYYVYTRYSSGSTTGSSTSTTATPAVLDPNAIDPNTGLTYGAEESAALNANAGLAGGSSTGTVPTDSNLTTGTNELGDLGSFLDQFGSIAQQLGYSPPGTSTTTVPAPVAGSSPSTNASTSGKVTDPNHTRRMHPLVGKGAVAAPSGPKKPPPKKGFTVKGLGGGAWEYVPVRPVLTKPKPRPKPKPQTKKNVPLRPPAGFPSGKRL